MKRSNKIVKPLVSILTVMAMCLFSSTVMKAFAVTYGFTPLSQMYTTTTIDVYSDTITFGHSSQEADCSLSYGISVPPNTSYGSITVRGVLQKKTPSNTWLNIRTLNATGILTNTSSVSYKYVIASASGYADLVNGGQYRVKFTVTSYNGGVSIKLNPTFSIDYVIG